MALNWKVTLFLRSGKQGFSESWVRMIGGGTAADRALVESDTRTLANLRGAICGLGTFLSGARISFQDAVKKRSVIVNLDPTKLGIAEVDVTSLTGYTDTVERSADVPTSSIQFRMYAADSRAKNYWMGSIPDLVMRTNPDGVDISNSSLWNTRYGLWKAEIMSGRWGFRARTLPATDPLIAGVGLVRRGVGLGVLGVVTNGVAIFGQGQRVQVRGFKGISRATPRLAGLHVVDTVDSASLAGQTVYFLRGTEALDDQAYDLPGSIQKVDYEAVAVAEVQPYRQGRHKRGRPFGQQVGRRSTPPRG